MTINRPTECKIKRTLEPSNIIPREQEIRINHNGAQSCYPPQRKQTLGKSWLQSCPWSGTQQVNGMPHTPSEPTKKSNIGGELRRPTQVCTPHSVMMEFSPNLGAFNQDSSLWEHSPERIKSPRPDHQLCKKPGFPSINHNSASANSAWLQFFGIGPVT